MGRSATRARAHLNHKGIATVNTDRPREVTTMPVPVDDSAGNDPASFPALTGAAPAPYAARILARLADGATVFCWWMLATSGTPGVVAAGVVFVVAVALLLARAQTPGEALLGLVALDVETGEPAPGAAFVKLLLQLALVVGTLGLGAVALVVTTRGPLRRNLADRATGVVLASLRADAEAGEAAAHEARWAGPALDLPKDDNARDVRAQLQLTGAGLKVRAGTDQVVITSPDGTETWLTPGDGALAPEGATIRCGEVTLRVGELPSVREPASAYRGTEAK